MVEAIGGLWIQHGGGVGGGEMTEGEENPLWARTWASEPCFFHEIREHVVACMFEISTSTSPLFTLHFPSFVNLKQKHQKTPSRQSAIENLGVGKQECKMRKTISNGRWESPSFWVYDAVIFIQILWSMRAKLNLFDINLKVLILNPYIINKFVWMVHI